MQFSTLLTLAAAAAAPASAFIDKMVAVTKEMRPGGTAKVTMHRSVYIQNFDDFGIVWGLAPTSMTQASCPGCVGRRIDYTNLWANNTVKVPETGNFDIPVIIPKEIPRGRYLLVGGTSFLVGASGFSGFNYFNKTISIQ
ncbi:hypothetical protein MAPG_06957 [Magnaporthiopsis poae ATCC 64411]|uniref:Uncharacterized protein n=1 Tax=Magnaporthiopsis poae (strain ATCC 64411 / 73-15) TaxID=644358 RepID=A0A0C4E3F8_MAGP6|nr:hypothetical protein MAPG_06957 [Magnaporthiopsis poae ATCC 64411]